MKAEKFFTHPAGVLLSAVGATFLWGSAFPIIKKSYERLEIGSDEIGEQLLFAGYRFFLAGVLIWLLFLFMKQRMIPRLEDLGTLTKVGFFQTFVQYIFFYIGLSLSTGVQGSIIAGTTSFFQIILAHFMYRDDKINMRKIIGLAVGFAGVVIANLTKGNLEIDMGLGEWLLVMAMLAGAFGNILAKNASREIAVGYLTSFQMLIGGAGLIIVGMIFVGLFPFEFDVVSAALLLYLAFLSAAGFILWNNVMKYNAVGRVSMYMFLVPVFGVILSALILDEKLHMIVIGALFLVAAGIIIVNRDKQKSIKTS